MSLRIPDNLFDRVAQAAEDEHRSMNSYVVVALEAYLTPPSPVTKEASKVVAKKAAQPVKRASKRAAVPDHDVAQDIRAAQKIMDRVLKRAPASTEPKPDPDDDDDFWKDQKRMAQGVGPEEWP
jgi:hypothetical protein